MARIFGCSYRRKSIKALLIDSLWLVFFIIIVVCKNFENAAFSPGAALPREIAYLPPTRLSRGGFKTKIALS